MTIRNRLLDPDERGLSHGNLADYLERASEMDAAAQHELAAGVYFLVSTRRDHLVTWLNNLRIRIRRAAAAGGRYELPRLAALLDRPEFEPLAAFLAGWGVDAAAVQGEIDRLVEMAREKETHG